MIGGVLNLLSSFSGGSARTEFYDRASAVLSVGGTSSLIQDTGETEDLLPRPTSIQHAVNVNLALERNIALRYLCSDSSNFP